LRSDDFAGKHILKARVHPTPTLLAHLFSGDFLVSFGYQMHHRGLLRLGNVDAAARALKKGKIHCTITVKRLACVARFFEVQRLYRTCLACAWLKLLPFDSFIENDFFVKRLACVARFFEVQRFYRT